MAENKRLWKSLQPPLHASILAVIEKLGFETMTPVQAATIPLFRGTKDVCVEVKEGKDK